MFKIVTAKGTHQNVDNLNNLISEASRFFRQKGRNIWQMKLMG
jgi:hypothetical protein